MSYQISAPVLSEDDLPGLDVYSEDRIEDRLENLKRRPTWKEFLETSEYCQISDDEDDSDWNPEDHEDESDDEDSDDEDEDDEEAAQKNQSSLLGALVWTPICLACFPLLLLYGIIRGSATKGRWPLGCSSVLEMVFCAFYNVANSFAILFAGYWYIAGARPMFGTDLLGIIKSRLAEKLAAIRGCIFDIFTGTLRLTLEGWLESFLDVVVLCFLCVLLLNFHRRWSFIALFLGVMIWGPIQMYVPDLLRSTPRILSVDPTFAMVEEETLIAIDGRNLEVGSTIAWIPYWGCFSTTPIAECEKQFEANFQQGVVAVAFNAVDEYIPCYKGPLDPLKEQVYSCFKNVRLRVKEKRSLPGWSSDLELNVDETIALESKRTVEAEIAFDGTIL